MSTYDLRGKTVLITGAARGIGAEAARQLHARGANLALVGLEPDLLAERVAELGDRAAWFEADVTEPSSLEAAVAGTVERFGGIDVLIANAGIAPNGPVSTIDPEAFERTVEVNFLGVWRTVRAALPHVTERGGYILLIASMAAAVHRPLMAPYAASKAAVEAFGNALRQEVAHTGTRVGVAYFSFIQTDMVSASLSHGSAKLMQERVGGAFVRPIPVARAGEVIVAGVERRSRIVYAPRWVLPMLMGRTLIQPLLERQARSKGVDEAVRLAETEQTELTTPQR
jgi:NAD(P)-dependent dehydrogenase (short-subunit alcohol dehydrogenase family)